MSFESIVTESDATRIAMHMKHHPCRQCKRIEWNCRCDLYGQPDCRILNTIQGVETYDWGDFRCSKCRGILDKCKCDSPLAQFISPVRPSGNSSGSRAIHRMPDAQAIQILRQGLSSGAPCTLSMCARSDRRGLIKRFIDKEYIMPNPIVSEEPGTCQCRSTGCSGNSLLITYLRGPKFGEWPAVGAASSSSSSSAPISSSSSQRTKDKTDRKRSGRNSNPMEIRRATSIPISKPKGPTTSSTRRRRGDAPAK